MRLATCLAAFAAVALSTPASAVLIGDKEWMTFALTGINVRGSADKIDTLFDSTTGACDAELCKFDGFNQDFTGYVWASTGEVNALFQTYGFEIGSLTEDHVTSYAADVTPLDAFFDDFGATIAGMETNDGKGGVGSARINAWTRTETAPGMRDLIYLAEFDRTTDYLGFSVSTPGDSTGSTLFPGPIQGWFYKPVSVPEPGTLLLLSSTLAGLALARRRRPISSR